MLVQLAVVILVRNRWNRLDGERASRRHEAKYERMVCHLEKPSTFR